MKHRWGERIVISANKTERECLNGCGIVKVTRHEFEGGRPVWWTEFWRGLDRIDVDRIDLRGATPSCEPISAEVP